MLNLAAAWILFIHPGNKLISNAFGSDYFMPELIC